MKEAEFYVKKNNNIVQCQLCPRFCIIPEGQRGNCKVRENQKGKLYSLVYGYPSSIALDPIEKKPLYHFLPGSSSFSIATIGCNFRCGFCQNWQISQSNAKDGATAGSEYTAIDVVSSAIKSGCKSISYTYTEPTIFFEFALDTARIAREKGLYNVFVTNGFMTAEALDLIRPYLDAANVDLKFFRDEPYKKICSGSLEPVLNSIRLMKEAGVWLEVTTLVVPGENDSEEELYNIAKFIASVDKDIPWHISRFHPDYKFNKKQATPEATLKKAQALAEKAGLNFVYAGNVSGWGSDTHCPNCKELIIEREMFSVLKQRIEGGKCAVCGAVIPGVFR